MSLAARVVVTVLAAVLLSSLVAPRYLAVLHWGAYLPMFWVLREDSPRSNRWLLVLYGMIAEGLIFSWISDTITLFSNIPAIGAIGVNALFAVVFGLRYPVVFGAVFALRRRLGSLWIVALPAWLVLIEYALMKTFLFPYNQGISQYRTPWVWQIASVTGVWGLSYLVLFFNAAFAEWIYRRREGGPPPTRWMAAAVLTLAAVVGFGAWRYQAVEATLADAPVKRVHQVQSRLSMVERMQIQRSDVFKFWYESTDALKPGEADLSVWPEGACPYQLNESLSGVVPLWQLVKEKGFDLIVGAGTREREPDPTMGEKERQRIFNSVYAFRSDRVQPPEGDRSPAAEWAKLAAAGCRLEDHHVLTPVEAGALAAAGESSSGDAACVASLRAKEVELRTKMKVDATFEAALLADPVAFAMLRVQTERLVGARVAAVKERAFDRAIKKGSSWWVLTDASCPDADCLSIWTVCQDGQGCDVMPDAPHYDKMVPLPFGEYLPLAETFPILAEWIKGPGDFRAGTEAVVFEAGGARLATPICYEGILGYVCRRFDEPDLFVNVTNDAWFGDTAASDLHGMLVAARAIELGVPVFRSAYAGVSFVVEPHGRIHAETELFHEVSRVVDVRLGRVSTVYGALGDWFVAVCALLLGGLWARSKR